MVHSGKRHRELPTFDMKIRATQLLKVEEFPQEFRSWLTKLVGPVNDFLNQVTLILNQGITFADNVVGVDHLYTFTYTSDAVNFPLNFQWTSLQKPLALTVVSALEDNNPVIIAVSWSYTQAGAVALNSAVKLTAAGGVTTLKAGSVYNIRARITP